MGFPTAQNITENWVFLGDSLTEGVGSSRISYVNELAQMIRNESSLSNDICANIIRLRRIDPNTLSRFVVFNIAGFLDFDESVRENNLWFWNLACEGQTIESDEQWIGLLESIKPSLIFIFRGSLESIVRPSYIFNNDWPWWVPSSWRSYAAMDPRCYFSTTWWRKAKQVALDAIKQKMRHKLLRLQTGIPLMKVDDLISRYTKLLTLLRKSGTRVIMLGLVPVSGSSFPGSPEQFKRVNERLREVAVGNGAEFFDWGSVLLQRQDHQELFYRDGFHPNLEGARTLAAILHEHLAAVISR